ncbi:LysR family transcriptional regulator [Limoniibacter endophyticus]|uniref:LysR family transcriptional regulator n=1 Tax=Limoniibacter endophyticus TaxID=1565040 RepID=A0A8J3GIJ0_9HYPH|nr:LysR family transcriptional regulator [Limoniibacter endophyticus]GHC72501.1 LysR family transcriptional regulator [Limoniibacter endophyticus]
MSELGDLHIFAKVVALRSMSEAARSLGIAPAVVSKSIKRLEESLGVRLLQRTTRRITVTELGQDYYKRIANALNDLEEATLLVSGQADEASGLLRVSAPTSFGRMHIAPHLGTFMQSHPRLNVELNLSDDIVDVIADGYDIAVRITEPRDSSLIGRKLARVRRVLCASREYVAKYGYPQTIDDLKTHRCLQAHGGGPWHLEGPEGPLTIRPESALLTNSSEVVREATISGLGIALRSTWDVGEELHIGKLVRVLPSYEGSRNIWISAVFASRQHVPMKIRAFVEYLVALYGPRAPWDRMM